jgi:hypothetical protein
MYGFLADLTVAVHVGYVAYVVIGELLILLGWAIGWRWVRNFWFRITHLLAIVIVVAEEGFGVRCPLTIWEEYFRRQAGQSVTGETFVGRLLHALLFYEETPQWVFIAIHVAVGVLVLVTFILCPPRRPCVRRLRTT